MTIRKQFICDVVEKYKKDYPEKYQSFLKLIEFRRSNADDKMYGTLNGEKEIRVPLSLPDGIMNAFEVSLKEEPIFTKQSELRWFIKKFPEFTISRSY